MARTFSVILIMAAYASSISGCRGCGEEADDEALIHELIKKGAALAEQKKVSELMEITTKDFRESRRNMDRRSVRLTLLFAFRRYGKFRIRFPHPDIRVQDSRTEATARIPFIIVQEGRQMPDVSDLYEDPEAWISYVSNTADPYYLNLGLIKEGDDWVVKTAQLTGMRGLHHIHPR